MPWQAGPGSIWNVGSSVQTGRFVSPTVEVRCCETAAANLFPCPAACSISQTGNGLRRRYRLLRESFGKLCKPQVLGYGIGTRIRTRWCFPRNGSASSDTSVQNFQVPLKPGQAFSTRKIGIERWPMCRIMLLIGRAIIGRNFDYDIRTGLIDGSKREPPLSRRLMADEFGCSAHTPTLPIAKRWRRRYGKAKSDIGR